MLTIDGAGRVGVWAMWHSVLISRVSPSPTSHVNLPHVDIVPTSVLHQKYFKQCARIIDLKTTSMHCQLLLFSVIKSLKVKPIAVFGVWSNVTLSLPSHPQNRCLNYCLLFHTGSHWQRSGTFCPIASLLSPLSPPTVRIFSLENF